MKTISIGMLAVRDQLLAEADGADAPMLPCPAWCTMSPGHAWDSLSDRGPVRSHEGPEIGAHLLVGADEFAEERGVLVHDVMTCADLGTKMSPDDLRDLARNALAAADWLEGQQATAGEESA